MNGKTSPGKANSEFSPVSIKGTRQVIKYAKIIAIFRETNIFLKSLGLRCMYFFSKPEMLNHKDKDHIIL